MLLKYSWDALDYIDNGDKFPTVRAVAHHSHVMLNKYYGLTDNSIMCCAAMSKWLIRLATPALISVTQFFIHDINLPTSSKQNGPEIGSRLLRICFRMSGWRTTNPWPHLHILCRWVTVSWMFIICIMMMTVLQQATVPWPASKYFAELDSFEQDMAANDDPVTEWLSTPTATDW